MNYGLIAIYDTDFDYANSLANYFRLKGCLSSEIVVFTKTTSFNEFIKEHSIDILLISRELLDTVSSAFLGRNMYILCSSKNFSYDGAGHCLYRFSSAEDILQETMACYEPDGMMPAITFTGTTKSQLIGIYSPVCRCGKTSFSISLAIQYSIHSSCLLLCMDEASPLKYLLHTDTHKKTLDDLLYYFLQTPHSFESKLISIVQSLCGVDVIPPSQKLAIYSELTPSDWVRFLQALAEMGRYEYIIIDLGTVSPVHPLLTAFNHLYVPTISDDEYSVDKIAVFKEFLHNVVPDERLHTEEICLPYISYHRGDQEYLQDLSSGPMGQLTASIVNKS